MEEDHNEEDQSFELNSGAAHIRVPPPPPPSNVPGWMSHIPALPVSQFPRAPLSFAFGTSLSVDDNNTTRSLRTSSSFNDYLQLHHPAYAPPAQVSPTLSQSQSAQQTTRASFSPNQQYHTTVQRPTSIYPNPEATSDYALDPALFQNRVSASSYIQNGTTSTHSIWSSDFGASAIPPSPQDVEFGHAHPFFQSSLPSGRVQSVENPSNVSAHRVDYDLRNNENDGGTIGEVAELEMTSQSTPFLPAKSRKRKQTRVPPDDDETMTGQQEPKSKKRRANRSRAMANIDPQLDDPTNEEIEETTTKSRKEPRNRGRPKGQKTGLRPTLDPGPEFMNLYNEAMDAFIEQDDVILAQTKVLQAIGVNPEIFAAHSLLADIHFAKGDHDKGLDALIGGLHAHMNDVELWRQVADTILAGNQEAPQKRLERAMYCYGAILRKEPMDMDARFQRAECARLLGHVNRAFKDLDILLQDDPHNSTVLARFTKLCQDVNDAPKAKIMYEEHFEYYRINGISEEDSFTWQDVGIYIDLIIQAGENGQAIIMLKRLSRWLSGRRDEDFWEEYLEDDREFDQNHYPRRLEAPQFEPNKYPERDYGEALPLDLRAKLGILRLKLNYREEAQSHFDWLEPDLEEEESLVEEYSDNFMEIAKALFDAKEHKEALRFYNALENSGIDHGFEFWIGLGASAYVCEQRQKALKAYEQALVVNSGSIEARTQLAKLYRDLNDRPNALKYGREAVLMSQDAIPQTGNRKYENKENRLLREAAERALKGAYRLPKGSSGVPGKVPDSLKYRTRMKSKFFKYVPRETEETESEADPDYEGDNDGSTQRRKSRPKKFGPHKKPGPKPKLHKEKKPAKRTSTAGTPALEVESDEERSVSKQRAPERRTTRPYRKQPSRIDPQKHYEDVQALYQNLLECQSAMREGDEEATSRWMDCAQAMIDDFRTIKVFFPGERHQKFTGYTAATMVTRPSSSKPVSTTNSPAPTQSVPALATEAPLSVEDSRSSKPIRMVDRGVPNDYCGIPFPVWLDIFLELALLTANSAIFQSGDRDLQTDCYSIINAAIDCNVFYHHSPSLSQIHVVYLCCCLSLNDDVTLYNTVLRWFMNEFTFCTDTYRLYSTVALLGQYSNVEGKSRIEGSSYRSTSNQKFLFRQLCSIDQQLPKDYGIGTDYGPVPGFMRRVRNGLRVRKGNADDEEPPVNQGLNQPSAVPVSTSDTLNTTSENPVKPSKSTPLATPNHAPSTPQPTTGTKILSPREMDVVLFILYSHIMMANNSFTNALNYLYRALSLDPSNTVCLLSMALCYLTELFKRQVGNRHALSLMGWMWFGKYEAERKKWAERVDKQRADAGGDVANRTVKMIDLVNREIEFNRARCWEMMGMPDLAVRGYKKMLSLPLPSGKKKEVGDEEANADDRENSEEEPETYDMEAAYAMSTIYMINGDGQKAREIVEKFMVVE